MGYVLGGLGALGAVLFFGIRAFLKRRATLGPLFVKPEPAPKPILFAPEPVAPKPKTALDSLIASVASAEGISPVLLKAIVAKESSFNSTAINPETSFVLAGVSYSADSREGRNRLREFILTGGDPKSIGLNPSVGLAQVRVGLARKFVPGVTAKQLFDPQTNLTASARFLKYLFLKGITLDTIDAYNVGEDLAPRNLTYRNAVKAFVEKFKGDF